MLAAAISGIVRRVPFYVLRVGNALKWFPDRLGLASGLDGRWIRGRIRADHHSDLGDHQSN